MSKEVATKATAIEAALIKGDLSQLNVEERVSFYNQVCSSLGLNPLTKPFGYIQLNGKLVLYALKDATDQIRNLKKISVNITAREKIEDVYVVTAKAKNSEGREDESTGAVAVGNLKGDALANAFMKAETKAKRRVTLSICGLGILDESELDSIKDAKVVGEDWKPAAQEPRQIGPVKEPPFESPKEAPKVMAETSTKKENEMQKFAENVAKAIAETEAGIPNMAPCTQPQRKAILDASKFKGWSTAEVAQVMFSIYGVDNSTKLTITQADELLTVVKNHTPSEALALMKEIDSEPTRGQNANA